MSGRYGPEGMPGLVGLRGWEWNIRNKFVKKDIAFPHALLYNIVAKIIEMNLSKRKEASKWKKKK